MTTANETSTSARKGAPFFQKISALLVLMGLCGGLLAVAHPGLAQEVRTFTGHTGEVYSVAFSRDGRHVLSASADTLVKLWDASTGREIRIFSGHTGPVWAVAFIWDGGFVLSGSADKTMKLWEVGAIPEPVRLASDFDGNSKVDFEDFFLFAAGFGTKQGEPGYDARFDLNRNGQVDLDDFFMFAADFGRTAQ